MLANRRSRPSRFSPRPSRSQFGRQAGSAAAPLATAAIINSTGARRIIGRHHAHNGAAGSTAAGAGNGTQGEQETHAAIIEHRRAGLSWAKVADKLNGTGHRTRTGGQWTRQGAHQVRQAATGSTAPPRAEGRARPGAPPHKTPHRRGHHQGRRRRAQGPDLGDFHTAVNMAPLDVEGC